MARGRPQLVSRVPTVQGKKGNREKLEKSPCQGKNREFGHLAKTQVIYLNNINVRKKKKQEKKTDWEGSPADAAFYYSFLFFFLFLCFLISPASYEN